MFTESERYRRAIERLDAAHAEDPRREEADGVEHPYELLYARRMSEWLERVAPDASETLRLAVRAQHLRRWTLPRDAYPMTRPGYHAWRTELKNRQAEQASTILHEAGYDEAECQRVAQLIRKENLRRDADAQALEDTACLVFLRYYFSAFAPGHDDDKLCGIVRKTWKKMSPRAHELAAELPLSAQEQALIMRALA